jgi:hypothetical protein
MSVGKSPRLSEAADLPLLQKMVKQSDADHLLAMIDRCLEADMQIDRNVQLVLVLEALLDALIAEPVAPVLRDEKHYIPKRGLSLART